MTILIAYATMSGNTHEVAELIQEVAELNRIKTTMHRIGSSPFPVISNYSALLLGTYTWGKGETPKKVKKFVAEIGYKPENVYIFGTGDTQFGGDDLFCYALDKLAKFYGVQYPILKIEQSPRGLQEARVKNWAEGVIRNEKTR